MSFLKALAIVVPVAVLAFAGPWFGPEKLPAGTVTVSDVRLVTGTEGPETWDIAVTFDAHSTATEPVVAAVTIRYLSGVGEELDREHRLPYRLTEPTTRCVHRRRVDADDAIRFVRAEAAVVSVHRD